MHRVGLLVVALLVVGCAGEDDTDLGTDETDLVDTDVDVEDDPCALYTWQTVGEPYMRAWCSGCHGSALPEGQRAGAPVGIDFDTHEDVLDWIGRVEARATGEGADMPPGGGPSEAEREDFAMWVSCGAPE